MANKALDCGVYMIVNKVNGKPSWDRKLIKYKSMNGVPRSADTIAKIKATKAKNRLEVCHG